MIILYILTLKRLENQKRPFLGHCFLMNVLKKKKKDVEIRNWSKVTEGVVYVSPYSIWSPLPLLME